SSTLRCSFGSIQSLGLKVPFEPSPRGTKQAIWQDRSETSNSSTRRAPLCPARRRDQVASTPHPSGVTRPTPVMTTRRMPNPRAAASGRGRRSTALLLFYQNCGDRTGKAQLLGCVRVLLEEPHG